MQEERGRIAGTALHPWDFAVITIYFAFVLFIGLWTSRKNRGSAGGYFLAGRNMNFIPVGASLFASNIGSIHFVGLAGSGAAAGIAIALYEHNSMYVLMILAYIFLPVYISSGADLYAGAIFIEQSLDWDIYPAMLLLLAIAAIFTITGGLTAVIWTDFIQTIIMLLGAFALMGLAFAEVGGFNAMVAKYPEAMSNYSLHSNLTCGKPRDDYMHLFRDPATGDLPWPGLLGITINSIWYWCSDQVIVQRALAGKTFDHAKAGTILCAYLKTLPLFLLVFPGMIARILFPDTVGCSDPTVCEEICGSKSGCSNIAYPTLVINLMPPGARGMMLAVMLAALMSSLTSIFNSSSTIFAMDIWCYIRKNASELEVMIVGRIFVIVLVVISIIWVPVLRMSHGSQLYVNIMEVASCLQPPICAVFLLAILWQRLNEKGAFFALVVGLIVGLIRFIIEYSYDAPACWEARPDPTPAIVKNFHYLYFSAFLFALTATVAIVISLLTAPIDPKCLRRLTFWTRHNKEQRMDIEHYESHTNSTDSDRSSNAFEYEKPKELVALQSPTAVVVSLPDDGGEHLPMKGSEETSDDSPHVVVEDDSQVTFRGGNVRWYRRIINWVCGIEGSNKSIATHQVHKQDMICIDENRLWRIVSNIAAVGVFAIVVVMERFSHE